MSQIFISKNNSTIIPLDANASFVGATDILTSYQELDINVAGAPNNASAMLYFEFSPNGINWDVSVPLTLTSPDSAPIILRTILPYFRVRYNNGGIALTEFRLTTIFHRTNAMRISRFLNQTIDVNEPVEIVRIARGERSTIGTTTSVSASDSNVTLLAVNANRSGATIFNESTSDLYVKLGATASLTSYSVRLIGGAYFELPYGYTGIIDGIWASATGAARITEFT